MSSNATASCDLRNSTTAVVVLTACYCILILAVLIGNILIVLVMYKNKKMRKTVNWFILNVALSDLLVPFVFVLPEVTSLLTRSMKWHLKGVAGSISCKLLFFLADVSLSISVFSIVLISLERFVAVVFPMRVSLIRGKVRVGLIVSSWIMAIGLASPYFYTFRLRVSDASCVHNWEPAFDDHTTTEKRYKTFLYSIEVLLPFILLCFFYTCILISVRRRNSTAGQPDEAQRIQREQENSKVTRTAVAIVCAFAVCFVPLFAFQFIQLFLSNTVKLDVSSCSTVIFYNLIKILLCLDGALNPLICFIFLEGYRKALKALFCSPSSQNRNPGFRRPESLILETNM